jgi:hypothetical protein
MLTRLIPLFLAAYLYLLQAHQTVANTEKDFPDTWYGRLVIAVSASVIAGLLLRIFAPGTFRSAIIWLKHPFSPQKRAYQIREAQSVMKPTQPDLYPPLGFGINRGLKSTYVEPPPTPTLPFEYIFDLYPHTLGGFRAPDKLGVLIHRATHPFTVYGVWLEDESGKWLSAVMYNFEQFRLTIQPGEQREPLHFGKMSYTPGAPVVLCIRIDSPNSEPFKFKTHFPLKKPT